MEPVQRVGVGIAAAIRVTAGRCTAVSICSTAPTRPASDCWTPRPVAFAVMRCEGCPVPKKAKYQLLAGEVGQVAGIPFDRKLTAKEIERINTLVETLRRSASGGKRYRLLYHRAKDVQKRITDPEQAKKKTLERKRRSELRGVRGVLPAGLVRSSALDRAGREVLGGLPSSRRGH